MKSRHLTLSAVTLAFIGWLCTHTPQVRLPLHPATTAEPISPLSPAENSSEEQAILRNPDFAKALSAARHRIRELTGRESLLPQNDGTRFFADNPAQNLTARFHDDGILIRSTKEGSDLKITRRDSGQSRLKVTGTRAEYLRPDGSTEWMENSEKGFEHGMTLSTRPHHAGAELRFAFSSGNLTASHDPANPSDLIFSTSSGEAIYGYRSIKAWDATGRGLPAKMAPSPGGFEWIVDDRSAVYPVTIDPLVTNLVTTLNNPTHFNALFGVRIAMTSQRVLVGANRENTPSGNAAGAAYLFNSLNGWQLETRFESPDPEPDESFGARVALGPDDIVISAFRDTAPISYPEPSLFVYRRNLSNHWEFNARLKNAVDTSFFEGVHLNDSEIITSLINDNKIVRSVKTGGVWSPLTELFSGSGSLGWSTALKNNLLVSGAPHHNTGGGTSSGQVRIDRKISGTWQQETILTPPDPASNATFGTAVATDGTRIAVTANTVRASKTDGVVHVYRHDGSGVWTLESTLIPPFVPGVTGFGTYLALSGDFLAVSSGNNPDNGAYVNLYRRVLGSWIHRARFAMAPDYYGYSYVVFEGNRLAIGKRDNAVEIYDISSPFSPSLSVFSGPDHELKELPPGDTLDLGTGHPGQSLVWPITLFNEGSSPIPANIAGAYFTGPGAAGFSTDLGTFPVPIPGGQVLRIHLTGQFPATGNTSASLVLVANNNDLPEITIPLTLSVVPLVAPPGLTIAHQGNQVVLKYPHTQFTTYQIRRCTDFTDWAPLGQMQTETDPLTTNPVKIFRDFSPPPGRAFYQLTID